MSFFQHFFTSPKLEYSSYTINPPSDFSKWFYSVFLKLCSEAVKLSHVTTSDKNIQIVPFIFVPKNLTFCAHISSSGPLFCTGAMGRIPVTLSSDTIFHFSWRSDRKSSKLGFRKRLFQEYYDNLGKNTGNSLWESILLLITYNFNHRRVLCSFSNTS